MKILYSLIITKEGNCEVFFVSAHKGNPACRRALNRCTGHSYCMCCVHSVCTAFSFAYTLVDNGYVMLAR